MANFSTGLIHGMAFTDCLRTLMANGRLAFYGGIQPTSADKPAPSVMLGLATINGLNATPGSPTNGLNFDDDYEFDGTFYWIRKEPTETWKMKPLANGTATWCRLVANPDDNNSQSTTLMRIDMSCGGSNSTAECKMANTSILSTGGLQTIDVFRFRATNAPAA